MSLGRREEWSISLREGGWLPLREATLLSYPERLVFRVGRPGCIVRLASLPSKANFLAAYRFPSLLLCREERPRLFESNAPEATKLPEVGSRKFFCDDRLEMFVEAGVNEKYVELEESKG